MGDFIVRGGAVTFKTFTNVENDFYFFFCYFLVRLFIRVYESNQQSKYGTIKIKPIYVKKKKKKFLNVVKIWCTFMCNSAITALTGQEI